MTDLSIIVPVLNEAAGIPIFHSRLVKAVAGMNLNVNIIYVNDGSTDATQEVLNGIVETDSRVTACELSRNFGHQAALSAGLEYADGRLIVMLDGDGQHPPELIGDMIRLQSLGYDIVQCQRIDGANSASVMKRLTARLFYLLLKNVGEVDVPAGSADFRLITQDVLKAFKSLPEYHRFIRGMIPWLGFRSVLLPYQPGARLKGETRYSVRKMLRLAADGVFSFSLVPLRLGLIVGSTFLILGIAEITYVLAFWFSGRQRELVPGWSSTIMLITFSSGSIMILLGFIGIYVGMIFQEVKRRPVFIVRTIRQHGSRLSDSHVHETARSH